MNYTEIIKAFLNGSTTEAKSFDEAIEIKGNELLNYGIPVALRNEDCIYLNREYIGHQKYNYEKHIYRNNVLTLLIITLAGDSYKEVKIEFAD